jgi:hypothetical protein
MGTTTSVTRHKLTIVLLCQSVHSQVGSIFTLVGLCSSVIAVGSLIDLTNFSKLAGTACMQRDHVLTLIIDTLYNVDLSNRILIKIIGPAFLGISFRFNQ